MEHRINPDCASEEVVAFRSSRSAASRTKADKIREVRSNGRPILTRDRLAELLHYDPRFGVFRHKVSRGGKRAGDIAGTVSPAGYRLIFVDYFQWRASHLAWLYMTGGFPPPGKLIDHRDCVRSNDRWNNLRLATPTQNARNRRPGGRNSTGKVGVHLISDALFGAAIWVEGRNIHLGRFKCLADAVAVRCKAEKHYFGDFAAKAVQHGGAAHE